MLWNILDWTQHKISTYTTVLMQAEMEKILVTLVFRQIYCISEFLLHKTMCNQFWALYYIEGRVLGVAQGIMPVNCN